MDLPYDHQVLPLTISVDNPSEAPCPLGSQNYFNIDRYVEGLGKPVGLPRPKQTDTSWLTVLEEQGLNQVVHILENNGIDSETDGFQPVGVPRVESLACQEDCSRFVVRLSGLR
jgi:hypothetical protein